MSREIKLKSGKRVSVRAQCINPKCRLLLISYNSNPTTTNKKEKTIHPDQVANQDELKDLPMVYCVHCR
jgi:hypothetical protein